MLQFDIDYIENEKYINSLISDARRIIENRENNYIRYCKTNGLPIERYIATTGTSYFAGKEPTIKVKKETDKKKITIVEKIFNKILGKEDTQIEYQLLLDYINDYNDLPAFFYSIAKDYFITNACYWISYETNNNEIVYAQISSLQSVALYDYSTPMQLHGGLRLYQDIDNNGEPREIAILTLPKEKRYYVKNKKNKTYKEDISMREDTKWKLTPFYSVENPDGLSLFDSVKDLIDSLEQVIENQRNIFQYNDEAKLKVTGYLPAQPLLTEDDEGNVIENPDRKKEDEALLKAKVFYTPDKEGDIDWLIKNINDVAILNYTKTLIDFIFMLSMVPNMNDISFTDSDSGKAIEHKFFGLEQVLIEAEKLFKKELLRMYENITYRINTKKKTKYDFREVNINLTRNLPVSKEDVTKMWTELRGLISDETVIENLPLGLDARTELAKKQDEEDGNLENSVNRITSKKDLQDGIKDIEENDN